MLPIILLLGFLFALYINLHTEPKLDEPATDELLRELEQLNHGNQTWFTAS